MPRLGSTQLQFASLLTVIALLLLLAGCARTADVPPAAQSQPESTPTLLPIPSRNVEATVEASIAATVTSIISPTPDIEATVKASIAATVIASSSPSPDIEATVQARLAEESIDATAEARTTATAVAALTPTPDIQATVEAQVAEAFINATVQAQVDATVTAASATAAAINCPVTRPSSLGGAPLPEKWTGGEEFVATESTAKMLPSGVNGLSGTLHLIQIGRKTKVTIGLEGPGPCPYAAAIRRGGCPDEGREPTGQFDYLLFNIVNGESISMVNTPAQFFQFSLAYVVVVAGQDLENDLVISCGNIPSPLR